jgi:hypothetical protein
MHSSTFAQDFFEKAVEQSQRTEDPIIETDGANQPFEKIAMRMESNQGTDLVGIQSTDNVLVGSSGNDFLYGTSGADTIYGLERRDFISGGGGADVIIGGGGNDILNGGGGNDTFCFAFQHEADIIQDFRQILGNRDVIALGGGIDGYVVTVEWNGIRIATIDWDYPADYVQGSITLTGVSATQWRSWGGLISGSDNDYVFGPDSVGPSGKPANPMIVFSSSDFLFV